MTPRPAVAGRDPALDRTASLIAAVLLIGALLPRRAASPAPT